MIFWIIITAMSVLVALMLGLALIRRDGSEGEDAQEYDLRVYRDQLSEVDRDVARGVIADEDAERVRTEISRRILNADAKRAEAKAAAAAPRRPVVILVAAALIGGSLLLYQRIGAPGYGDLALEDRIAFAKEIKENRPSQQQALDDMPPIAQTEEISEEFSTLIQQLRETVANRPDDLKGHQLLAQNEARLGDFAAAALAQEKVLRIKGEAVTAQDIGDYGELLVMSVGGYVSPEAEVAFRAVLARDERDARSRYYLGLLMVQTGRPDVGFRLWDDLLRRGPPDAPWIDPILAQIEPVAQLAGVNYSIPAIGAGDGVGPTAEDVEAAAEMTADERMAMIAGMVEGLSDRLATEGGPPSDWARLITSLAVMGDQDQARAVYDNAVEVFGDDPAAMDTIRAAGSQAGVAE